MAPYVGYTNYSNAVQFGRLLVEFGYLTTKSLPKHIQLNMNTASYMGPICSVPADSAESTLKFGKTPEQSLF